MVNSVIITIGACLEVCSFLYILILHVLYKYRYIFKSHHFSICSKFVFVLNSYKILFLSPSRQQCSEFVEYEDSPRSDESSDHAACVSFLVLYYPEKGFIYSVGPLKPGACCGACGFCDCNVSKFCYMIEPMIAI